MGHGQVSGPRTASSHMEGITKYATLTVFLPNLTGFPSPRGLRCSYVQQTGGEGDTGEPRGESRGELYGLLPSGWATAPAGWRHGGTVAERESPSRGQAAGIQAAGSQTAGARRGLTRRAPVDVGRRTELRQARVRRRTRNRTRNRPRKRTRSYPASAGAAAATAAARRTAPARRPAAAGRVAAPAAGVVPTGMPARVVTARTAVPRPPAAARRTARGTAHGGRPASAATAPAALPVCGHQRDQHDHHHRHDENAHGPHLSSVRRSGVPRRSPPGCRTSRVTGQSPVRAASSRS